MITEMLNYLHKIAHGEGALFVEKLAHGLWNIFSTINGNPETVTQGIRFSISIFFALFLIVVLQLRARVTLDKKHIIALVGAMLLLFRYTLLMGFEWGWQIGLYNDWILHFLFPPLEYFFYTLFFFCIGYYSLNSFEYYPGLLKKVIWYIPILLTGWFIYATITWKTFFISRLPEISIYRNCSVDWMSHAIIAIVCLYIVIVGFYRFKKWNVFLLAFWVINLTEHSIRSLTHINNYYPAELATVLQGMATWSLAILILHFINAYVHRIGEPIERRRPTWAPPCDDCPKPIDDPKTENL